jgi:acyl carrier protein
LVLNDIPQIAWETDLAPERLHALLRGLPYTLEFEWRRQSAGIMILRRSSVSAPEAWQLAAESFKPIAAVDQGVEGGFWALCANRPLEQSVDRQLVPELRELLSKLLPEFMVPSFFVLLETFPLTPSGKIDRHRLPAPSGLRPQLAAPFTAPRNSVEERLVLVWSDVLGVEGIGVFDNFFELGGHSLLATQVISRLRRLFGVEVPLRELFERPTAAVS